MKYVILGLFMSLVSTQAFATCFPADGTYLLVQPGERNYILDIKVTETCDQIQFRHGVLDYSNNNDTVRYSFDATLEVGAGLKPYTHKDTSATVLYEILVKERDLMFTIVSDSENDIKCTVTGGFGYDSFDNPVDGSTFTLKYKADCQNPDGTTETTNKDVKMYRM